MDKTENNFTFYKVSPVLLNKFGPNVACVHAVIWNKSKKEGYECKLSEAKIGNELHISYATVRKALVILLENNYIKVTDEVNEYGTKSYEYVPEMVEFGLTEEEKISLKSNDARIADTRERGNRKKKAKNIMINDNNDCGKTSQIDGKNNHIEEQFDDMGNIGINNYNNKDINKEIKDKVNLNKSKPRKDGLGITDTIQTEDNKHKKILEVKKKIENRLHILADDKKWDDFISFTVEREERFNQPIDKFIDWFLDEKHNIIFFPPEKLRTIYPQAFVKKHEWNDNFCKPLPPIEEDEGKDYIPMPREMRRKRELP